MYELKDNMSTQEIFDYVVNHLLIQNTKSIISTIYDTYCAYRGDDNCKCAAGCLIKDDEYNPSMENVSIFNILNKVFISFPVKASFIDRCYNNTDLILTLQHIHDKTPISSWKDELKYTAVNYNLEFKFD